MLDESPCIYILYIILLSFYGVFHKDNASPATKCYIIITLFFLTDIQSPGPTEIAINRNTRTKRSVILYDIILLFVYTYTHIVPCLLGLKTSTRQTSKTNRRTHNTSGAE